MDLFVMFYSKNLLLLLLLLFYGKQTNGELQNITTGINSQEVAQLKAELTQLKQLLQNMCDESHKIIYPNEEIRENDPVSRPTGVHNEKLCEMQSDNDKIVQQNVGLRACNEELVKQINDMKLKYEEMKTWQDDVKAYLTQNGHFNISKNATLQAKFAAFSATPSVRRIYQQGEKLIFDKILSNVGAHYNGESSTFNCPVSGYYFFTVTVMNHHVDSRYHNIGVSININGVPTGIKALVLDKSTFHQATNSGVMLCQEGDVITAVAAWSTVDLTLNYGPWSSFSGWLLSPQTE